MTGTKMSKIKNILLYCNFIFVGIICNNSLTTGLKSAYIIWLRNRFYRFIVAVMAYNNADDIDYALSPVLNENDIFKGTNLALPSVWK